MPDAHISLHSCSTVLLLGQNSVYEVLRIDAQRLETLLVSTDFAEAEQVQMAFIKAFRQNVSKVPGVISVLCSIAWSMPILKQPFAELALPPAG